MSEILYATTSVQIEHCWHVMHALRPHLHRENFVQQVQEMMSEGYQLIYVEQNGIAVACAGFRSMQMLYSGKIIYIDDLSTLPDSRGKGYASMLLDFIHELAVNSGKQAVHLDSGYQRHDAHRLYLNKGYKLASHHFAREHQTS